MVFPTLEKRENEPQHIQQEKLIFNKQAKTELRPWWYSCQFLPPSEVFNFSVQVHQNQPLETLPLHYIYAESPELNTGLNEQRQGYPRVLSCTGNLYPPLREARLC